MESGNEPLTVVRVAEFVGDGGVDEGRRLCDLIRSALAAGRKVELDFAGVEALAESFLEAAVARLLDDVPFDDLLHRLIVSNMTARDVQRLRYVLERARGDEDDACRLGDFG